MRRESINGSAHDDAGDGQDLLSELVDRIRGIDERLGHSPDHATGSQGSGLCKVVAELKAESDYQSRMRSEKDLRSAQISERIKAIYSLVGAAAVLGGTGWAAFKLLVMLVQR
jgi:hypothetical protein